MTVIRYIANESKRFRTYVANRIAVGEESNPSHWKCLMTASPIPLVKLSFTSSYSKHVHPQWPLGRGAEFPIIT